MILYRYLAVYLNDVLLDLLVHVVVVVDVAKVVVERPRAPMKTLMSLWM